MLRGVGWVCQACRVRPISVQLAPSWQLQRGVATAQKRRPSRHVLSDRVSENKTSRSDLRSSFERKDRRDGPFGGMNTRSADIRPSKWDAAGKGAKPRSPRKSSGYFKSSSGPFDGVKSSFDNGRKDRRGGLGRDASKHANEPLSAFDSGKRPFDGPKTFLTGGERRERWTGGGQVAYPRDRRDSSGRFGAGAGNKASSGVNIYKKDRSDRRSTAAERDTGPRDTHKFRSDDEYDGRRPARHTLSRRVSLQRLSPPTRSARPDRSAPFKGRSDSPFGGMNSTSANIRPNRWLAAKEKSDAERKRMPVPEGGTRKRPFARSSGDDSTKSRVPGRKQDFKALKMQRILTDVSYQQRAQVKAQIADVEQFDELSLLPALQESISSEVLKGLTDVAPTPIQRLAISELLSATANATAGKTKMQQFLLAAETGSGKTLAYLLPVIDAIKRAESKVEAFNAAAKAKTAELSKARKSVYDLPPPPMSNDEHYTCGKPRAIILVPSAELVDQVGAVAKSLSHTVKFRAVMLSANYTSTVIRNRLFAPQGVDLVITTPHLLSSIIQTNPSVVSQVTHMVIDEADSLFDRSFAPTTGEIIDRATPSLQQLTLCSATIPRSLDNLLRNKYPDMKRLTTPKLHSIPRRVQMTVVDASKDPYQGNKDLACADTIWNLGRDGGGDDEGGLAVNDEKGSSTKYVIVFVNTRDQTGPLAEYLVGKGIQALALDRDTSQRKSGETLGQFTSLSSTSTSRGERSDTQQIDDLESGRSGFETNVIETELDLDTQSKTGTDIETLMQSAERSSPPEIMASRPRPRPLPRTHRSRTDSSSPSASSSRQDPASVTKHKVLPGVKVLVTTDISSRGIDTTPVKNVVLYDVPHSTVDFIHRLGRVGRMGRRGRAVVIVGKGDRRDVVREVRMGMFAGTALV